jgi:polyferredoxin
MQHCPFCGAAIDHAVAEASAIETSKISQACSDASYLKIMLGILIPFGALVFFPFLGHAGLVGFVFIKYAIPVMAVRWWFKYGRIQSKDPDLRRARKTVIVVSVVWVAVLLFVQVHLFGLTL